MTNGFKSKASLPEMPASRRERYIREFGLPEYDAMVLTLTKKCLIFEAVWKMVQMPSKHLTG